MLDTQLNALYEAGLRTVETEEEEFYCLVGKRTTVTGVVKPKQFAWKSVNTFQRGGDWWIRKTWGVTHDTCPKGTIADVHTHPNTGPRKRPSGDESVPSEIDIAVWQRITAYDIHGLIFMDEQDRVWFRLYIKHRGNFQLLGKVRGYQPTR